MKLELNITATTVTLILLVLCERSVRGWQPVIFIPANCADAGMGFNMPLIWSDRLFMSGIQ